MVKQTKRAFISETSDREFPPVILKLIKRFQGQTVLIYCDPPYVLQTRSRKQYRGEMNNEQHEELLEVLADHPGPGVTSG